MKKRLAGALQLLIGFGLLALILRHLHRTGNLAELGAALAGSLHRWPLLVLGFSTFGVCLLVCTARWQRILRAQGFRITYGRALMLYLVGQFFNAFMLGATGGDLVKAWYVAAETPERKTEIVATVFIERLIGLLALIVLAPAFLLLRLSAFWGTHAGRATVVLAFGLLVPALAGLLLLFGRNWFDRFPRLRRLTERGPVGATIRRVYEAFHLVLAHRGLLATTLALSAVNHVSIVFGAFAFGCAAGLSLGLVDYLSAFLMIGLISGIPVTPSGIGTRETAALVLLGALGATQGQAVTVSLMLYGCMMGWSLLGGAAYLVFVAGGAARPTRA